MLEVTESENSQTMDLLEGYLNLNPTESSTARLAIVDEVALEYIGGEGEIFVDLGKSGTGEISVYTVRSGDTIGEIADMFGVSTNTIIWANNLRGSSIKVGQELVILPISGVRHIVKSGDTLQSLSTRYKASLDDILSYNDLSLGAKIQPGDTIIIPDGVISAQTSPAKPAAISAKRSQSLPTHAGFYLRPLVGGTRSQGLHGNNGIDIAAPVGTLILASAEGKVIIAKTGYNGGYGNYVVVSHANGTQTLYAHMTKISVSAGQSVTQGETLGTVGNTGKSTGPHLHFEVRGAKNPF